MLQHYVLYGDNDSIHRRPPGASKTENMFDNKHSFDYARTKDESASDDENGDNSKRIDRDATGTFRSYLAFFAA